MSELNYLEKLLDGVEVEWVTLGSMADIGTGSSNRQDESENGIYPFYVRSKNILKSDTFEFDEVAIVILVKVELATYFTMLREICSTSKGRIEFVSQLMP